MRDQLADLARQAAAALRDAITTRASNDLVDLLALTFFHALRSRAIARAAAPKVVN